MNTNAAIIGVGQSAYTRRPQPGQSTHTFIRDAVVVALEDAEVDPREVDGMAVASFSLALSSTSVYTDVPASVTLTVNARDAGGDERVGQPGQQLDQREAFAPHTTTLQLHKEAPF